MKNLSSLNSYFWKYKRLFLSGVLFIILTNVFGVYSPKIVKMAMDLIGSVVGAQGNQSSLARLFAELQNDFSIDISSWFQMNTPEQYNRSLIKMALYLGLLYLVIYIIKGVFLFFTRQTLIVMSRYIEYDLKNEIFEQYQRLETAFYKRNNTGDLMNRISEDVSKVRMYLGPGIMYTINLVFLFIFTIWFMIRENWELTLWTLAPLPLMSVIIYYVSDLINRKSNEVQVEQSKLSTLAQETFSGIRVIKAFVKEQHFKDQFFTGSDLFKKRQLERVKVDALFMPVMTLLIGLSTSIAIYVGGLQTMKGEVTVGNIAEFIMYVNMLTWPFAAVGWVTSINQQASASMARINEFLQRKPEIVNTNNTTYPIEGEIEFKNVSFVYPDSGIIGLKDINLRIPRGSTLAIVGHTGSGKTTFASLLTRMYDVTSGEITIDGINIKEHNLNLLRTATGYVPQDVFLFSESIRENISFGLKGRVEMDRIVQAAEAACIHDNIAEFAQGYDTVLGERGITLSGGQKQRVSIARAIIKNPDILLFDDCLSAVDTDTEDKILGHLSTLMNGKTSIIISHRISTVKHADQIIVLENGEIIEQGNHAELIQKGGKYSELFTKQQLEQANLESSNSSL
ncbi:MAG TPA: ABC transporter ATP-binding protein [Luteibaculaceae bacterium]|nr:ABC transporter ATP-binding protein [Luteibaculaceae bacterium]